ncbi:MAG: N-acetylmuramoyl-L-alanine amidase [Armatimonadota bacterium]
MRLRLLTAALLTAAALCALPGARPASAEVSASGTKLSIGGGSRFYMTYGHVEDPELYAPVIQELRRLQITFTRSGSEYVVRCRGGFVGSWPIVTSRDEVPETGEHPVVLVLGGNAFVPLRKLAELCALDVRLDTRSNEIALVPDASKRPQLSKEPEATEAAPAQAVTLTGLDITPDGEGLQVRVRASGPVRPQWLPVTQAPVRVVIDFPNARWAPGIQFPASMGPARAIRTGHPVANTARVVFEVPSVAYKVTRFDLQQENQVVASVGIGAAAVNPPLLQPSNREIVAIQRRGAGNRLASRQGIPGDFPSLGPIDRNRAPLVDPGARLVGRVIVVDPGHGGKHGGAQGLFSSEKDLCLKMGLALKQELEAKGAQVIITRDSDVFVSLDERCAIANRSGADIFISVHCNSTGRRNSATGTETYWRQPRSKRLAETLHPYMVSAVGRADRGVRNASFQVIRETNIPSVLLEVGYINNAEEELLLATPEFHQRFAESVTQGVLRYFGADTVASN